MSEKPPKANYLSLDELVAWLVPYYCPPISRPIHFLQLVVYGWPVLYRTVVPYTWHLHYINYLPSLDFMYTEHREVPVRRKTGTRERIR